MLHDHWNEIQVALGEGGYLTTDLFAIAAACYVSRKWPEEPLWVLAVAPPGSGKALSLDTPIPTPDGWKLNGELRVGDLVFGGNGKPCRVTHTFDVMEGHDCLKVVFSDGNSIVADADHLWETMESRSYTHPELRTTREIGSTLFRPNGCTPCHKLRRVPPVECTQKALPIPPYTLGVWLGDGNARTSLISLNLYDYDEIAYHIRNEGITVEHRNKVKQHTKQAKLGRTHNKDSLHTKLRRLDLFCNRHIPAIYLRSSIDQRIALLQGLMDTDGHTTKAGGGSEFYTVSPTLKDDVFELLASLGLEPKVGVGEAAIGKKLYGKKYRIGFRASRQVVPHRISRKRINVRVREECAIQYRRRIELVEQIPSVPVRCIKVNSPDSLYLAGKSMVPTHNTATTDQFRSLAEIEIVSSVTPASLISGWGGQDVDPSLFARVHHHLLIAKDFGTILSMSSTQIGEIFSLLREAFDGYVKKSFGMFERNYPDLHFNFLAVTTEACERVMAFRQQLGERFIRFNVSPVQLPSPPPNIDPRLKGLVTEWMGNVGRGDPPNLTDEQYQWIALICRTAAKLRTEVIHDNYSKEVLEIPQFEGSARLEKQIGKLFQSLLLVLGDEGEIRRLCKHAVKSSIKPRKLKVLRYLLTHDIEKCSTMEISEEIRHGHNVVRRLMNDLYVMDLVIREMGGFPKRYQWRVADEHENKVREFLGDA